MSVLLVPLGLVLAALVAALCYAAMDVNDLTAGAFLASLGLVGVGFGCARRAWRARPADILFEAEALRIDGGEAHDVAMKWSRIHPEGCDVVAIYEGEGDKQKQVGYALDVGEKRLAIADDEGDVESLREVLAAIRARARASEPDGRIDLAPRVVEVGPAALSVLTCPTCGSPVAPSGDESVRCGQCSAQVPMPQDIRERCAAALILPRAAQRVDRIVARLLDQPGARATSIFLAGSLALIGGAWPIAIVTGAALRHAHTLNLPRGLALAALPFGLIADGFFLSRLRLVDRRALATLTLGFAAHQPARVGEPSACRSCGAPLRDTSTTVVRCVFCSAANLTGIDVRGHATRITLDEASLEDALADRRAERWKWGFRTVLSLPLFVATLLILRALW